MPTCAERLATLMEVYGDTYRAAAERCGLDHSTLVRVRQGETENPVTLERIAEGYGVPLKWLQGEPELATDFTMAVLLRPLEERKQFLWLPGFRCAFALQFLQGYRPQNPALDQMAVLSGFPTPGLVEALASGSGDFDLLDRVGRGLRAAGIPAGWLETGLLNHEAEEPMLVQLAEQALRQLVRSVQAEVSEEAIRGAARALV